MDHTQRMKAFPGATRWRCSERLQIGIEPSTKRVFRIASKVDLAAEDVTASWPQKLQTFIISGKQHHTAEGLTYRIELYAGEIAAPEQWISLWNESRAELWQPETAQQLSLREWLLMLPPIGRVRSADLVRSLRATKQSPLPAKASTIDAALAKPITATLHRGYVHGALLPRRIREEGFICWRHARSDGLRGSDSAPYLEPANQPVDVLLLMLKWAWNRAPLRAAEILLELGVIDNWAREVQLSFHHSVIDAVQLTQVLGAAPGTCSRNAARRALLRASRIRLAGETIKVHCSPALKPARNDRFFLPRNRRPEALFSRWHSGIQVDEEGRYSLTPESAALRIAAKAAKQGIDSVADLFCGCGGNAIAFARSGISVKAVDTNAARLQMAQHNARIYQAEVTIEFLLGDGTALKPTAALAFIDPPWALGETKLMDICQWAAQHYPQVWAKLPSTMAPPAGWAVELFLTSEGYPSFLIARSPQC